MPNIELAVYGIKYAFNHCVSALLRDGLGIDSLLGLLFAPVSVLLTPDNFFNNKSTFVSSDTAIIQSY